MFLGSNFEGCYYIVSGSAMNPLCDRGSDINSLITKVLYQLFMEAAIHEVYRFSETW